MAHWRHRKSPSRFFYGFSAQLSPNGGDKEEDGAKPLRQPREGRQPKPIRQAENEIPVFELFASLANMDPRTKSELIAKKCRDFEVSPGQRLDYLAGCELSMGRRSRK